MIFLINNRFEIDIEKNTVTDRANNQVQQLEYRLMAVLRLLISAKGEMVEREQMIRDVWNNYPGGDEGLNQAVSHLRKYFEDNKKEIIRTIPKKGYVLTAIITEEKKETKKPEISKWGFNRLLMLLLVTGITIISFLVYENTQAIKNRPPDNIIIKNEEARSKRDSIHQAETMKKYENKK